MVKELEHTIGICAKVAAVQRVAGLNLCDWTRCNLTVRNGCSIPLLSLRALDVLNETYCEQASQTVRCRSERS